MLLLPPLPPLPPTAAHHHVGWKASQWNVKGRAIVGLWVGVSI